LRCCGSVNSWNYMLDLDLGGFLVLLLPTIFQQEKDETEND
jgi:hypothetical protein